MPERESLFHNLLRRRVFQFVGMYVAATWLVIELGDWVTERFDLPDNLTPYVFIGMISLLPAVILFAYGHGAPGKDRWTRMERIFIPLNLVAAAVVLFAVDSTPRVEAATQTVRIEDETGVMQNFEVARRGQHRELLGLFWTNASGNAELDWLSYGLPIMMAHDIDRVSPVITVATPFDPDFDRDLLPGRASAPEDAISRGLAVQIARDRRSGAVVLGSFDSVAGEHLLSATVIDATTGEILGVEETSAADWLDGVDRISARILEILEVQPSDNKNDDPLRQHFSESIEAVRHFTRGEVAINLENDFPTGITEYTSAVSLDPGFAEARGSLSVAHYLSGDLEAARAEATLALRDSYRLSDASKFALKAQRYVYDGDFERVWRVLEIWAEVQPTSTRAYALQARILRLQGGQQALDRAQEAYDRLLELNPNNFDVLLEKAEVEQQRRNFLAAADYLRQFLELEPDSDEARIRLASVYQADGQLDEAQEILEDAAVLSDEPVAPGLALARLQARRGEYDTAIEHLDALLLTGATPQMNLRLLTARMENLVAQGRIRQAMEVHGEVSELARELMPPMLRLFTVDSQEAGMLVLLGETDAAIAIADRISAQIQPPLSDYMNFTYSGIYAAADNRQAFRQWAEKSLAIKEQLPDPMIPFILMEQAQLAVWDGKFDEAIRLCDEANALIAESFIQLVESDTGVFELSIRLADLYLDAGAISKAEAVLQEVLRLYPGNAHAKLVLARGLLAKQDNDLARELLREVADTYAAADADFVYLSKMQALLARLDDKSGS